jgi:hypothetical protein
MRTTEQIIDEILTLASTHFKLTAQSCHPTTIFSKSSALIACRHWNC